VRFKKDTSKRRRHLYKRIRKSIIRFTSMKRKKIYLFIWKSGMKRLKRILRILFKKSWRRPKMLTAQLTALKTGIRGLVNWLQQAKKEKRNSSQREFYIKRD
jgi:hypothetical protein